ncbi:Protein M3 [Blyttiomyces sp. JEL0837]|nr:Protein M3 [Blyttiomyces sp. JEL0837]
MATGLILGFIVFKLTNPPKGFRYGCILATAMGNHGDLALAIILSVGNAQPFNNGDSAKGIAYVSAFLAFINLFFFSIGYKYFGEDMRYLNETPDVPQNTLATLPVSTNSSITAGMSSIKVEGGIPGNDFSTSITTGSIKGKVFPFDESSDRGGGSGGDGERGADGGGVVGNDGVGVDAVTTTRNSMINTNPRQSEGYYSRHGYGNGRSSLFDREILWNRLQSVARARPSSSIWGGNDDRGTATGDNPRFSQSGSTWRNSRAARDGYDLAFVDAAMFAPVIEVMADNQEEQGDRYQYYPTRTLGRGFFSSKTPSFVGRGSAVVVGGDSLQPVSSSTPRTSKTKSNKHSLTPLLHPSLNSPNNLTIVSSSSVSPSPTQPIVAMNTNTIPSPSSPTTTTTNESEQQQKLITTPLSSPSTSPSNSSPHHQVGTGTNLTSLRGSSTSAVSLPSKAGLVRRESFSNATGGGVVPSASAEFGSGTGGGSSATGADGGNTNTNRVSFMKTSGSMSLASPVSGSGGIVKSDEALIGSKRASGSTTGSLGGSHGNVSFQQQGQMGQMGVQDDLKKDKWWWRVVGPRWRVVILRFEPSKEVKFWVRSLLNLANVSSIIGLFVTSIPALRSLFVPSDPTTSTEAPLSFLFEVFTFIGAAAVPMGLVNLGAALGRLTWKGLLPYPIILSITTARLLIMPVLGIVLVQVLVNAGVLDEKDKMLRFVLMLETTVPTASSTVFFTQMWHPKGEATAIAGVILVQYAAAMVTMSVSLVVILSLLS